MLHIAEHLVSKAYAVSVVLPYEGELRTHFEKLGVSVDIAEFSWWCSVEPLTMREKFRRVVQSVREVVGLLMKHWSNQPDVVITNTITVPWGMLYSWLVKKPHIMLLREFGTLDFGFTFFFGYERSLQLVNAFSDSVFTNSKTTKQHFSSLIAPEKMMMLYPYVSETSQELEVPEQRYFTNDRALKMVILGSIIEGKGQLDAVRAVLLLAEQGITDIELIVAGRKQSPEYYQRLADELAAAQKGSALVKIVDFVSHPLDLIRQADVVLVCSRSEAFGRTTAEAMALKKPVIISNAGANLELIDDDRTGLYYEVGNATDLAEKILSLYRDREKLKKLGQAAFEQYTQRLQPKMNLAGIVAAIEAVT